MSKKADGFAVSFLQGSFFKGLKRGMTAPVSFGHTVIDLPPVVSVQIRRFSSRLPSDYACVHQDWTRVGESISKATETYGREYGATNTPPAAIPVESDRAAKRIAATGSERSRRVATASK